MLAVGDLAQTRSYVQLITPRYEMMGAKSGQDVGQLVKSRRVVVDVDVTRPRAFEPSFLGIDCVLRKPSEDGC